MKKIFSTFFVLVALLAMTTGAAFAGSALELVQVRNDEGVPTFVFRVTGEFSQEELQNGFVSVEGGEDFPLFCAQQGEDTVVCHTSKGAAGHDVVVGFGGAKFWDYVPEQGPGRQYCYPVYDYAGPLSPPGTTEWSHFDDYCQEKTAVEGESIYLYNPEWTAPYFYEFWGAGVDDFGWANPGTGYFYYFH